MLTELLLISLDLVPWLTSPLSKYQTLISRARRARISLELKKTNQTTGFFWEDLPLRLRGGNPEHVFTPHISPFFSRMSCLLFEKLIGITDIRLLYYQADNQFLLPIWLHLTGERERERERRKVSLSTCWLAWAVISEYQIFSRSWSCSLHYLTHYIIIKTAGKRGEDFNFYWTKLLEIFVDEQTHFSITHTSILFAVHQKFIIINLEMWRRPRKYFLTKLTKI